MQRLWQKEDPQRKGLLLCFSEVLTLNSFHKCVSVCVTNLCCPFCLQFNEHIKSCARSKSACPFSEVGCKSVVGPRVFSREYCFHVCWLWSFHVCFPSQVENGKLSEHEHSSTMEHVSLLLPMVLSLTRPRAEVSDSGEWQEDSGLGLYRAPEEGATMAAGAAASVHAVDLEKKVSLKAFLL